MNWYYAQGGKQMGPVEESALDGLISAGVVRDDTLVWHEGMAAWQPHAAVRGPRAGIAAPLPPAVPAFAEFLIATSLPTSSSHGFHVILCILHHGAPSN